MTLAGRRVQLLIIAIRPMALRIRKWCVVFRNALIVRVVLAGEIFNSIVVATVVVVPCVPRTLGIPSLICRVIVLVEAIVVGRRKASCLMLALVALRLEETYIRVVFFKLGSRLTGAALQMMARVPTLVGSVRNMVSVLGLLV